MPTEGIRPRYRPRTPNLRHSWLATGRYTMKPQLRRQYPLSNARFRFSVHRKSLAQQPGFGTCFDTVCIEYRPGWMEVRWEGQIPGDFARGLPEAYPESPCPPCEYGLRKVTIFPLFPQRPCHISHT